MGQPKDWQEAVDWMRRNGVEEADWDNRGALLSCRLGPAPTAPTTKPTTPVIDPEAARRAALLASVNSLTRGERLGG